MVTANQVAAIQGVQVNLQIHSWAEPNGYPGGGVLERAVLLKNRKPGDPHPFVDRRDVDGARQGSLRRTQPRRSNARSRRRHRASNRRRREMKTASRETCSPFLFAPYCYCGSGFGSRPARQKTKTDTALISSGFSLPSKAGMVAAASMLDRFDNRRAIGAEQVEVRPGQIGRSERGIAGPVVTMTIEAVRPIEEEDAAALGLGGDPPPAAR